MAVRIAHRKKINPGGQVAIVCIAEKLNIPYQYINKLMNKEEIYKMDKELLKNTSTTLQ